MDRNEKKRCANCLRYTRYYTIRNERLRQLTYGHCGIGKLREKGADDICEHWQSNEPKITEQNKCIYYTINRIEKILSDIRFILADKRENPQDD